MEKPWNVGFTMNPRKNCGEPESAKAFWRRVAAGHPLKMTSPVSGLKKPYSDGGVIGEDHEKQNQNKQSIITKYGDPHGALDDVRG
jgi:hypothetical protein